MQVRTELKITMEAKETLFEKYINSYLTGNIKNLTIKEEWIMLDQLKSQREVYKAEVERLKNVNLAEITNAKFELVKETIANEVKAEHEEQIAKAELNVNHYDFVIAKMEEEALKAQEAEVNAAEEMSTDNVSEG